MSDYLIIIIFVFIILYGYIKKVDLFQSYIDGVKSALSTIFNMFSTLIVFYIALSLLFSSGLLSYLEELLNFKYSMLIIQCLVRPISSSSSMSIMLECYTLYGENSFISILSTMIHYVSDASIYIITFYLGLYKINDLYNIIKYGVVINIFSFILSTILVWLLL